MKKQELMREAQPLADKDFFRVSSQPISIYQMEGYYT